MGETISSIRPSFNRSIQIEGRPEKLTCETGAFLLRDADERLGITEDLTKNLLDPRTGVIVHSFSEMLRSSMILQALGFRDQDDADFLRKDPALRLAVSDRRGVNQLCKEDDDSKGLASQPTLSRFHKALSSTENRSALRDGLLNTAASRLKADNYGHRQRYITIDVDSFPVRVDGNQPGSEFNRYYGDRVFHPIIATAAEIGDILDVKLRPGSVHTAEGSLEFILELIEKAKKELCQVAAVRMDAGFPDDETLTGLEQENIPYVARIKNNSVLDKLAVPYLTRPVGRPPLEPRTWTVEMSYQAKSWSKPRRVILVILEKPGELFLDYFWLVTSWKQEEKSASELLGHYRQRGTAEGVFGELMDTISPLLSSNIRPKTHYRGNAFKDVKPLNLSFWTNEVRLILAALSYNLIHAVRSVVKKTVGVGISIKRVRERYLRISSRIIVHARRATVIVAEDVRDRWNTVWRKMGVLDPAVKET